MSLRAFACVGDQIVGPRTVDLAVKLGEIEGDHGALLQAAADGKVLLWPVSRAVNKVHNNGLGLLGEVVDPGPRLRKRPPSSAGAILNEGRGRSAATRSTCCGPSQFRRYTSGVRRRLGRGSMGKAPASSSQGLKIAAPL